MSKRSIKSLIFTHFLSDDYFKLQLFCFFSTRQTHLLFLFPVESTRLWEPSHNTKKNYISHAPLWFWWRPWKVLLSRGSGEVLVKEQTLFAEHDVNKLSVVVLWVPHCVGLHCSDSLCLHDYWKVTILQRADRITLFRTSFFTLQQLDSKWCCNSLKPLNRTQKSTSFSKYHMDFFSLQEAENK